MTRSQRIIYEELLQGAYVMQAQRPDGTGRFKLYRDNMVPVRWLSGPDYKQLQFLLRWKNPKEKICLVLDKRIIRALHGRTTFKKLYKLYRGRK